MNNKNKIKILCLALGALLFQGQFKAPLDPEAQIKVIQGIGLHPTYLEFQDFDGMLATIELSSNLILPPDPDDDEGVVQRRMTLREVLGAFVDFNPDSDVDDDRNNRICGLVGDGRIRIILPKSPEFCVQFNEENLEKMLKIMQEIKGLPKNIVLIREFLVMKLRDEFGLPKTPTDFVKWSKELSVLGLGSSGFG